jgi:peptide/nickel transport system permease protein
VTAPSRATGVPLHRRLAAWFAGVVLVVGGLAPLLANDVPLAARIAGTWSFPAFADLVGDAPSGPGDLTWTQWWARLPADGDDLAVMPPWPFGPIATDAQRFGAGPSWSHWLGCDDSGRDVMARIVHGAHTFVWLAVPAVLAAAALGGLLGALGGHRRGLVDATVMRLVELFTCFPMLLFLMYAATTLGSSTFAFVAVLAAMYWPFFARIVRGELLSWRERDFVHVARGLGVGEWRILTRHLLPQVRSQVGVGIAVALAGACIAESTLSFLGIGPVDAASSWGAMLRQGAGHAVVGAWHLWVFPSLAIVAVVGTCHLLADRWRELAAARQ